MFLAFPHALGLALTTGGALAEDARTADVAFSQELFETLCIRCDPADAQGVDRAPDIRGATKSTIKRSTAGMDSMQDFHLDAENIADICAFPATLID